MPGVLIFWYEKLIAEILVATGIMDLIYIIKKDSIIQRNSLGSSENAELWLVVGCRQRGASKNDILIITIIGEGDWQTDRHSGRPALSDNIYLETYYKLTKLMMILKV